MVSDAPTPHSPPIAMPNMARSMSRAVRFGAKPDANSITEYNSTSTIKVGTASPAVGGATEKVCANRPHRQSQQDGERDVGDLGVEFLRDVLEHEHEKEEIESVKRPSEESSPRPHAFVHSSNPRVPRCALLVFLRCGGY